MKRHAAANEWRTIETEETKGDVNPEVCVSLNQGDALMQLTTRELFGNIVFFS